MNEKALQIFPFLKQLPLTEKTIISATITLMRLLPSLYRNPKSYAKILVFFRVLRMRWGIAPLLPAGVRVIDDDAIQTFERAWKELIALIKGDTSAIWNLEGQQSA